MTKEELKNKCTERAKIFQQAMESCHSSSPIDCIEWFADRIAELEALLESERDLPAIAYMQGAEKQKKKDAEELKKWKDEWQEQVQKANDEGYARTLQTMQLTKAKEFLNEFMRISKASDEDFEHDYSELIAEAEQFLKGEEE